MKNLGLAIWLAPPVRTATVLGAMTLAGLSAADLAGVTSPWVDVVAIIVAAGLGAAGITVGAQRRNSNG
jgi:hypothetical protein